MKIAYVVSRFPHLYQTFVRREIREVVRQGAQVDVFPVVGARQRGEADAGCEIPGTVHPTPLSSLATWHAARRAVGRQPGRCARLLARVIVRTGARPSHGAKSLVAFVKGLALSERVRAGGYTHIHAHWVTYPGTAALVASELTGIPFSLAFHAYDIFAARIMIPEKLARCVFAVVNCRYTLEYIVRRYPGVDATKLVLLYNGLDLPAYAGAAPPRRAGRPVILAVGQFVPTKGFDYLLQACGLLATGGVNFRLVLVGAGPQRNRLARLAREHGIADAVDFAGEKTEEAVRELLAGAAVLAMPCVAPRKGSHDALPNVVIEAQAAGVPVAATAVFGIPELIRDGETGLLVPPRDAAALKDALARLLSDPALAARLAAEGRRRLPERFDAPQNGRRLLELMRRAGTNT